MSDPTPAVSPTGAAILPQWAVKGGAAVVAVAGVALTTLPLLPPAPWVPIAQAIAGAVVALGAAFGIVSQGARKAGDDAAAKVVTVADGLAVVNKQGPQ